MGSTNLIKSSTLVLRFLLEMCALVALGYWGIQTGRGLIASIGLGLGAPLLFALVWGVFVAPQASARLPDPWRLILELILFGTVVTALYVTGRSVVALVFGLVVVGNEALLYVWRLR